MKVSSLILLALSLSIVAASHSLLARQKAPNFSNVNAVTGEDFTKISVSQFKGKYLVLLFYPFDFTYVCPTEIIAFSENMDKFRELNTEVLGISTDSHFTHLAWIKTERNQGGIGKINFPLVADISKQISRDYGVLVEDPEDDLYGAALRGLFIIDGNGVIRSIQINDAPVGRSVEETLRLIKAFEYTDKHGEVCPAGWQKGDDGMTPTTEGVADYLSSNVEKL